MLHDFRAAIRLMATHRWFSLAIVATLALGIGINTTVFTLVNAVLFKAMPFRDGERLVVVSNGQRSNSEDRQNVSYPDYLAFQTQSTSFEHLEAVSIWGGATVSESGVPAERYRLARVTPGFFKAFRVESVLGRGIQPADVEPGASNVLVLGYAVWKTRYGLSPDVLGRAVRINEKPATIVGVMPEGLKIPNREDMWSALNPTPADRENRKSHSLMVIGLLKPGVSIASASTDLDVITRRQEAASPDTNKNLGARVETFNQRFNGENIRTVFMLMLGAVGFVLLITCANVANMLLGRAIGRHREMSIRAALGASRWQIVRQLLVESVVLSFVGGIAGLGIAYVGIRLFDSATQDVGKPSWIYFTMDWVVVAYFIVICLAAGLIFGLAPALRTSRVDLNDALKEGGRGGSARGGRLSGVLVVAQFTLAVVLLAGAGLLMRSFVARALINREMPQREIMAARVNLPSERYATPEARLQFFETMQDRLKALPSVTHASLVSSLPGLDGNYRRIELEGALVDKPSDRVSVPLGYVSPTFFDTFAVRVTRGRGFDDRDGLSGREAIIVSEQFAATYFANQDPIGKRIRFNEEQTPKPWMTVVGVTRNFRQTGDQKELEPLVLVPYRQEDTSSMVLVARTAGDASQLGGVVRAEVQKADLDLALGDVNTFEALLARQRWVYVVFGSLFMTFAATALLMSGIGLYGVMSQAATRRTREIGIRVALGATPRRVLTTVMKRGVVQVAIGLALGLAGAFGATRAMSSLLFGVGPRDPIVFAVSVLVLIAVGLLSCWLPARRASTVPPVVALTHEGR